MRFIIVKLMISAQLGNTVVFHFKFLFKSHIFSSTFKIRVIIRVKYRADGFLVLLWGTCVLEKYEFFFFFNHQRYL